MPLGSLTQQLGSASTGPAKLAVLRNIEAFFVASGPELDRQELRDAVTALCLTVKDRNPLISAQALRCLTVGVQTCARAGSFVRVAPIIARGGDSKPEVRNLACSCLSACMKSASPQAVLQKAGDETWTGTSFRVREVLINAFLAYLVDNGEIDNPEFNVVAWVKERLIPCVTDAATSVREAATALAIKLLDSAAGPAIRTAIETSDLKDGSKNAILSIKTAVEGTADTEAEVADSAMRASVGLKRATTWSGSSTNINETKLIANLSQDGEDWEAPMKALKEIQELLTLAETDDDTRVSVSSLLDKSRPALIAQLKNLRSAVPREACRTIALASRVLGNAAGAVVSSLLPTLLLQSTFTNRVVSDAAHSCILTIFAHTRLDERALNLIFEGSRDQHKVMRERCIEFAWRILAPCNRSADHALNKCLPAIQETILTGLASPIDTSRKFARRAYWALREQWPALGDRIFAQLDPRAQVVLAKDESAKQTADYVLSSLDSQELVETEAVPVTQKPAVTLSRASTAPAPAALRRPKTKAATVCGPNLTQEKQKVTKSYTPVDISGLLARCQSGDLFDAIEAFSILETKEVDCWSSANFCDALSACSAAISSIEKQLVVTGLRVVKAFLEKSPETVEFLASSGALLATFETLVRNSSNGAVSRSCLDIVTTYREQRGIGAVIDDVFQYCIPKASDDEVTAAAFEFLADFLTEQSCSNEWCDASAASVIRTTCEILKSSERESRDLHNAVLLFVQHLDNKHTELFDETLSELDLSEHAKLAAILSTSLSNITDSVHRRRILEDVADFSRTEPAPKVVQPVVDVPRDENAVDINLARSYSRDAKVPSVTPKKTSLKTPHKTPLTATHLSLQKSHVSKKSAMTPSATPSIRQNPTTPSSKPLLTTPSLRRSATTPASTAGASKTPAGSSKTPLAPVSTSRAHARTPATASRFATPQSSTKRTISLTLSGQGELDSHWPVDLISFMENCTCESGAIRLLRGMAQYVGGPSGHTISAETACILLEHSLRTCRQASDIRVRAGAAKVVAAVLRRWHSIECWRDACEHLFAAVPESLISVLSKSLEPNAADLFVAAYDGLRMYARSTPLRQSLAAFASICERSDDHGMQRVATELIGLSMWEQRENSTTVEDLLEFMPSFQPTLCELVASRRADLRKAAIHCLRDFTLVTSEQGSTYVQFLAEADAKTVQLLVRKRKVEIAHEEQNSHTHACSVHC